MVLPAVNLARRQARELQCLSNLRIFGIGSIAYAADFQGVLPWDGYAEGDRPIRHVGPWAEQATWFNSAPRYAGTKGYWDLLAAYEAGGAPIPRAGDRSIFVCPSAFVAGAGPTSDDTVADGYFYYHGLDSSGTVVLKPTFWCYGFNTQLDGGVEDRNVSYRVCVRVGSLREPSCTVLISEKMMTPREYKPTYAGSVGQQQVSYKEFTTRHRKGGYVLMVDGHVSWFSLKEVRSPASGIYDQPGKIIWNPRH